MVEDGVVVGRRPQDASAPLQAGAKPSSATLFLRPTIRNICGAAPSSGAEILISTQLNETFSPNIYIFDTKKALKNFNLLKFFCEKKGKWLF